MFDLYFFLHVRSLAKDSSYLHGGRCLGVVALRITPARRLGYGSRSSRCSCDFGLLAKPETIIVPGWRQTALSVHYLQGCRVVQNLTLSEWVYAFLSCRYLLMHSPVESFSRFADEEPDRGTMWRCREHQVS